jgi:hypothetical protein
MEVVFGFKIGVTFIVEQLVEFMAIVGPDLANTEREHFDDVVDEIDGASLRVLFIDFEGGNARCVIDEADPQRNQTGNGPLAEQQGGEFARAISTTRMGDAALPAHAKSAEFLRCPRLSAQSFQQGTPSIFTQQF